VLKTILDLFTALWAIFNSPNNDTIVVSLIIASLALIFSHVSMYLSFKRVLKEKDERIKDLVSQRNSFQEIVLAAKGINRKSSQRK